MKKASPADRNPHREGSRDEHHFSRAGQANEERPRRGVRDGGPRRTTSDSGRWEFLRGQQPSNGAGGALRRTGELVNDDAASHPGGAALLDHASDGRSLASGLDPVVNQQNTVTRPQRGPLEPQRVTKASVVRRRLTHDLVAREETIALADGNETDPELDGPGTAQKESPRLDPADCRDLLVPERFNQSGDHRGQCLGIPKDRPYIRVTTDPPEVFKRQVTCVRGHERKSSHRRTTRQTINTAHNAVRCSDGGRAAGVGADPQCVTGESEAYRSLPARATDRIRPARGVVCAILNAMGRGPIADAGRASTPLPCLLTSLSRLLIWRIDPSRSASIRKGSAPWPHPSPQGSRRPTPGAAPTPWGPPTSTYSTYRR